MIVKRNQDQKTLRETLDLLELSEHNRELAETYLDLSEPENQELLQETEFQNFWKLDKGAARDIYYYFLLRIKEQNEPLAGRFIRLLARIGGSTAKYILSWHGLDKDFEYAEKFLTPIQAAALRAEYIAWCDAAMCEKQFGFLIGMGRKDPGALLRIMELCYNPDAFNTKMFLSAVYLHCVRPLEDAKSRLYIPEEEEDQRAGDEPSVIREMTDYLERRLINNMGGLFQSGDEPQKEELERLKDFVRESDPDQPMPPAVRALLSGRKRSSYMLKFFTCLAFLAAEHSDRFVSMLRLLLVLDEESVPKVPQDICSVPLDICRETGEEWFQRHMKALEEILPITEETYIRWAVLRKQDQILIRMAKKAPDIISQMLPKLSTESYGYLAEQIREGNPGLYRELSVRMEEEYRQLAAYEATELFKTGRDAARRYLLEELEIEDILPYVKDWRELYIYGSVRDRKLYGYQKGGLTRLHRRALVLECLRLESGYFRLYWLEAGLNEKENRGDFRRLVDERQIEDILKLLDEERVPALYQMEFLGAAYGGFYDYSNDSVQQSDTGMQRCVDALARRHGDWKTEYEETVRNGLVDARVLAVRVMEKLGEPYKEMILDCACDSAGQVRRIIKEVCAGHPEWEADMVALLKARKAAVRELAAEVLGRWGAENYREPLTQALEAEKTKKVKELIQGLLSPEGEESKEQTPQELAAELLFGGRKRKLSWFLTKKETTVHRRDGDEAPEDLPAAILAAYSDMRVPGIHPGAGKLAEELNPEELADFVRELYDLWMEEGAPAKKKWVLYAAAIHGGEPIVPVLYTQIQEWAKGSRGAMAAEAVRALALNGTSTALLQVDQIARRFRFRQVKAAAAAALSFAAEQLGITREELEDRIVPDLGFDERMERIFDYGRRRFRVILSSAGTLEVYDEKGKRLKNLPAPGKLDDPETAGASYDAWKLLKKQLKAVLADQTLRMEQALGQGRCWETEQWRELFVKNPVMYPFAAGLIWGVYEDGELQTTFRYMEDGSFNTAEEEEYELPADSRIGLVHRVELTGELLSAWKEQLSDYEVVQPVEQLERPVYTVTEEEREQTELTRFDGLMLNALSLSGKLLNLGWYRGEILDGGCYFSFGRMDQDTAVKLTFSGCSVGYENEDVTVGEVSFHKPGEAKRVGNTYETERYRLGEISPRYFSEIVLQVAKATASAKERIH